jgi:RNA polymerase sigma factor (sigma-70 family)
MELCKVSKLVTEEARSVSTRGGLFGFITRLGRPPTVDSDAELLDRFVRTADETAFRGIVRRHGLLVLAICRRRLRREDDAEDAFQAVFLALAKSARSIGQRESLPGWLYRVAYLVSLKAAGIRARHPIVALPQAEVPMPDPPTPRWETDELKTIIDAELAGLPDKFRAVVVLCLIEGRTNTEAATILGVPVGTIDSRLSTARKRLCSRLIRRGVAVGVGSTLGQMLGGPLTAAEGPGIQDLISHTIPAVLAEAVGPGTGAVLPSVANLAQGVTMMTMTRLRLLATMGVAIGLLGGTATGIYLATAADPPKSVEKQVAKTDDASPTTNKLPVSVGNAELAGDTDPLQRPLKGLQNALSKLPDGIKLEDLFRLIENETDMIIRVDVAAFRRLGAFEADGPDSAKRFLNRIYDSKAILPRQAEKMPLRDVLGDSLAQILFGSGEGNYLALQCTYQIRGSQIVLAPAFQPPVKPGVDALNLPVSHLLGADEETPILPTKTLWEQVYGGVVSVSADKKPLADILSDLRKQTGANIVFDPRCDASDKKKAPLTITLSDVRLYDALRVVADMAELKMVYAGNIYYVTTPENAKTFYPSEAPRRTPAMPLAPAQVGPPGGR